MREETQLFVKDDYGHEIQVMADAHVDDVRSFYKMLSSYHMCDANTRKVFMIKVTRAYLGLGLRDAKAFVEDATRKSVDVT